MTEKEIAVAVAEIMDERKTAYERWSYGKSWVEYRGLEILLEGGEEGGEIEFNEISYADLDEVFAEIDEMMDDDPAVTEAVRVAWESWWPSDEAAQITGRVYL